MAYFAEHVILQLCQQMAAYGVTLIGVNTFFSAKTTILFQINNYGIWSTESNFVLLVVKLVKMDFAVQKTGHVKIFSYADNVEQTNKQNLILPIFFINVCTYTYDVK